jgi:ABC-type phosphate/phosphonate transport system permease subunit
MDGGVVVEEGRRAGVRRAAHERTEAFVSRITQPRALSARTGSAAGGLDQFVFTFFNADIAARYAPDILRGMGVTIELGLAVVAAGVALGLVLACLRSAASAAAHAGHRRASPTSCARCRRW